MARTRLGAPLRQRSGLRPNSPRLLRLQDRQTRRIPRPLVCGPHAYYASAAVFIDSSDYLFLRAARSCSLIGARLSGEYDLSPSAVNAASASERGRITSSRIERPTGLAGVETRSRTNWHGSAYREPPNRTVVQHHIKSPTYNQDPSAFRTSEITSVAWSSESGSIRVPARPGAFSPVVEWARDPGARSARV